MKRAFELLSRWGLLLLITCFTAACGGGDDDSPSASTTVSGVASKGPIRGGTVNVYAVNANGTRGSLLGTTTTSLTDGSYQLSNLNYTGNIIVVVTDGTYVDEATGATLPNPGLKAALPSASGPVQVAVTPLTDVAFKQMSSATGGFSSANITNANAVVSTAFGVDILGTQPVDATDATKVANSSQAAIEYGVALAAISQMVANGAATDVVGAIQQIQADLSGPTPQLDATGPSLTQAITDLTTGPTPTLAPSITPDTLSVDNSISFFTGNQINPPANSTGVAQAKELVSDLRSTVLSLVDYRTGEVSGVLTTPFNATVQEVETVLLPELVTPAERIGWVVSSLNSIDTLTPGTTYPPFTDPVRFPGETLTITTAATGFSATATIVNATTTLLAGTVSVNDQNTPTSGSINITTLSTPSGNATAAVNYTGTFAGQVLSSVTLTGNITTPVGTFDFSDSASNQRLTASFSELPGNPGSMMLTRAYFKGVAATNTVRLTGTVDLPTFVLNQSIVPQAGNTSIPSSGTINAKIEALSAGTATLTLNGVLTGAFTNAATYNPNLVESTTNFPNWNATFDGSIVGTNGLNISTLLKASMPAFQTVNFEAKYTRVLADNSTIFLNSTGTSNTGTGITTANMNNQDGVQVALSFNDNLPTDSRFTGTMKTSGGETVGTFSTVSGVPRVTYTDGYFETLF